MTMGTVALGSDHAGYALKEILKKNLEVRGYHIIDCGVNSTEAVDYPDYAKAVVECVASNRAERGVVVCGTGIGMTIAANRNPLVRAALCTSGLMARLARAHNNANVLALGSRIIGTETALDCLEQFIMTPFEGGRHERRIKKLSE